MQLKKLNPMMGGDPTIDPNIVLIHKNETFSEQRNTGYSDESLDDGFTEVNRLSYINNPFLTFNGNETYVEKRTPWTKNVPLQGSDNLFGTN